MTTTRIIDTSYDTGRDLDLAAALGALAHGTYMAISGGRYRRLGPSAVALPVSNGYRVTIIIEANDLFTVRREFVRGSKVFDHGTVTDVYVDVLDDVAYRASCFRNVEFGEAA